MNSSRSLLLISTSLLLFSHNETPKRKLKNNDKNEKKRPFFSVLDALEENNNNNDNLIIHPKNNNETKNEKEVKNEYISPSPYQNTFEKHNHNHNYNKIINKKENNNNFNSSLDSLTAQQAMLREVFDYSEKNNAFLIQKNNQFYKNEKEMLQKHKNSVEKKKNLKYMSVNLPPVAAVKLFSKHNKNNNNEMIKNSLLLHQSVMHNKLMQTKEVQKFRCLNCFSIFDGFPEFLLKNNEKKSEFNNHISFLENENHKKLVKEERYFSQNRSKLLKRRKNETIGMRKYILNPNQKNNKIQWHKNMKNNHHHHHGCPHCHSHKVQWLLEYVHLRTHFENNNNNNNNTNMPFSFEDKKE